MSHITKNVVVFPASNNHRIDAGGDASMEIKHVHPLHASQTERADQLKEKYRVCVALISAGRKPSAYHSKESA